MGFLFALAVDRLTPSLLIKPQEVCMNQASQWRLAILEPIAPIFAKEPKLKAIIVGGSATRNQADQYSDMELGLFWSELPSLEKQMAMLAAVGGRPQFGKIYPFTHRHQPYEPGGYSPFIIGQAPPSGTGADEYPASEEWLADVIDDLDLAPKKLGLLAFIQTGIPLHGQALVQTWRRKIEVSPELLAVKIIEAALKSLRWKLWQLQIWIARRECLMLYREIEAIAQDLFNLLAALNRRYFSSDFKWLDQRIQSLKIKPQDLSSRLRQAFQLQPDESLPHLRQLTAEILELVSQYGPPLDPALQDEIWTSRWRTWKGPPQGWG
jgi:hypothetical protein